MSTREESIKRIKNYILSYEEIFKEICPLTAINSRFNRETKHMRQGTFSEWLSTMPEHFKLTLGMKFGAGMRRSMRTMVSVTGENALGLKNSSELIAEAQTLAEKPFVAVSKTAYDQFFEEMQKELGTGTDNAHDSNVSDKNDNIDNRDKEVTKNDSSGDTEWQRRDTNCPTD